MKAGWVTKTLGDIADVKGGKRVPKGYKLLSDSTEHPYITVSDFTDDGTIDTSEIRYISNEVFGQIKRYTISSKDLYLSIAGTIGKTGYVPPELDGANLTENACKLVLHPNIDRDFVYYFTQSNEFTIQAGTNTRTAAQPKLALERLKTIKLRIPESLPEQQRIVTILDEAFDGIATAKANAEKNLQNARALFESHLQSVFIQRGDGWVEKMLQDVVDSKCSLSYGIVQPGEEYPNGLPVIRPTDMKSRFIQLSELKRINPKLADSYKRTSLTGDELLLCVRGSTGVVSIASKELKGANVTRGIVPIRFNTEIISQNFAYYLLISGYIQEQIREKTYGAALMQINIGDLRKIQTPFPPLNIQEAITEKLDFLNIETQRLESIYRQKLAALDALKKSLLDQAFTGQL